MSAVIAQIRDLVDEVTDMERVYAPSETDSNAIPLALNEFPCALVFPGPTLEYILSNGGHRHIYQVKVQVIEGSALVSERAASVLPFVDRIIEKFAVNVTLGSRANSCIFETQSGFVGLEYGGIDYLGYEITLRVSEQAAASPAIGS
ncbi:MAG TPA: hypothetical protein VNL15_06110 [Dehalococcoidia bacterium]|nr:hypothetical protein [Dehalococcoidia bacterium]